MGQLSINLGEKKLLRHIELGGTTVDAVGRELVLAFVQNAQKEPEIRRLLSEHNLTVAEMAAMYAAIIMDLMPSPAINAGGPLLAPTLLFMEPQKLEMLLVEFRRESVGLSGEDRFNRLLAKGIEFGRMIKEVHDEKMGPCNLQIQQLGGRQSASGCLSALFLGIGATYGLGLLSQLLGPK